MISSHNHRNETQRQIRYLPSVEINLFTAPPENKSENRKTSRIGQENQELEVLGLVHALDTDNANLPS